MKILFLSHSFFPAVGGIETVSEFLATSFSEAGHEVRLLTWTMGGDDAHFIFNVLRSPSLAECLQSHVWADILFENNPSLRLSWPNIFFKRPYVVALHTWLSRASGTSGWQDNLKRRYLRGASKVIACSDALREQSWPPAIVIGNSYKQELFRIIPEVVRTNDFVFLGRLVSDKGAELAILAFHQFITEAFNQQDRRLTIIGDGPERERLTELVSNLQLENNVFFRGVLSGEQLVECLNQNSYLLVPSLWEEPFGIVVLEGMACGCLPIVSDGGGLPEAVGQAGIIVKRGSIGDLAGGLKNITENRDLEMKLRALAKEHLKAHSPELVSSRYLSVLKIAFDSVN